ncbi:MAG: hypothetical protein H6551_06320 [Chitinophagales bacterium]|nr:hypothetical protein [Chitinophagaceae bacterium]MCB9064744.1 hypothetical protein [Chitinophagales bacterium]
MQRLLATVVLGLMTTTMYAQRGATEIGIGAGVNMNGNPGANMAYTGNKGTVNYSVLLNGLYNVHPNVMVGIEIRMLELSRKSDSVYNTYLKTQIGGDGRKFVYAKRLIEACVVGNAKAALYRGYVYGGVAVGYAIINHDSRTLSAVKESYRGPDGGKGMAYGVQVGGTYGVNSFMGINAELALRRFNLNYDAGAPEVRPYTNLHYGITSYSFTVGVKFRILPAYQAQNDIPSLRGKGRSRH